MARDNKLYSGFMNHDYVLCFHVKDAAARQWAEAERLTGLAVAARR